MKNKEPERTCEAMSFRNGYFCVLPPHEGIIHTNNDGRWWVERVAKLHEVNIPTSPLSFRVDGRNINR